MKVEDPKTRVLTLARKKGVLRVRDLREAHIHPEYLRRLLRDGAILRISRGLYIRADADFSEHHGLALVARWIPHAVVCLLSALRFHNLGTQLPREIWIALGRGTAQPRLAYPPLKVVRFSGPALTEGIETRVIDGVLVCIYSAAKTVIDCFRFRNRIGLDVFLEALRDGLREGKFTSDELWHYAQVCRVSKVIRPYLEAGG